MDGTSSAVLIGTAGDRLVATVMVGQDGHRGWVYYLAVRADARGHGYGREMMRAAEAWLQERGIPKLNLMVRAGNDLAVGFYRAVGYDTEDVEVFSRRLDSSGTTPGVGPVLVATAAADVPPIVSADWSACRLRNQIRWGRSSRCLRSSGSRTSRSSRSGGG